jgi:oleandomycin transport system ATP-binding protein
VPVTGDGALAEAVYRLTDAGIAVTELSLMLPSLDQVFFSLTGRHTETEAAPEPAEVLA